MDPTAKGVKRAARWVCFDSSRRQTQTNGEIADARLAPSIRVGGDPLGLSLLPERMGRPLCTAT